MRSSRVRRRRRRSGATDHEIRLCYLSEEEEKALVVEYDDS